MDITIADRCFKLFNSWLTQPYSPNLTNGDKILANLKRIGHIDRKEWSNSFDIICNALGIYNLTLVHEMTIENIRLNKENNLIIDMSFTMLNPDVDPLYTSFTLDSTLNLLDEAKGKVITAELDNMLFGREKNIKVNEAQFTEEIVKTEAVSLPAEGIENTEPATRLNVKANLSCASLSKSYRSLPFFPQLSKPTTALNSSVNEHLVEQLTRSPTPGLVQE